MIILAIPVLSFCAAIFCLPAAFVLYFGGRRALRSYRARFCVAHQSWRTTHLGVACIAGAIFWAWMLFVPSQSVYFHLCYVWRAPIVLILVGWALIHARDHKAGPPPIS
jgi:hypothetical protein